jgi:phosphonoacetaldehyde hydrolase
MSPPYRGPIKAAILDWAGTTVDFGSCAPVAVIRELFAEYGIELTNREARAHMGLPKRNHIRAILNDPRVEAAWIARTSRSSEEGDVDRLYAAFEPRQIERACEFSNVIPGIPEVIAQMRERGLRIGSTTGYTRGMLEPIMATAAQQGYRPNESVTPDEAGGGRPAPWMCFQNLIRLNVFPPAACVKIGDTPSDIAEGLNAGMWTVGVIDSGNEIGLTPAEWDGLDEPSRERLRQPARKTLRDAGAHFTVDSLAEIGRVFDEIERRLGHP